LRSGWGNDISRGLHRIFGREIPRSIIISRLYAARHSYGTFVYQATKNVKVVMDSMGHSDVRTTMRYQHPELEQVRIAIDKRNAQRHNSRHSDVVVQ
jgi:integrase